MLPPALLRWWWRRRRRHPRVGRRRLLFLLGLSDKDTGDDVFSGRPRVRLLRLLVLSLFANAAEIWLSPLVDTASGSPRHLPAFCGSTGLLAMVSIACTCRFLPPPSAARDGRCAFRGTRCVAAGGRRRWLMRHVQGWKSLVQLVGGFGSGSGACHQHRPSERLTKLRTRLRFDVFTCFFKVLFCKTGDVLCSKSTLQTFYKFTLF
jgi:hypothetical protein